MCPPPQMINGRPLSDTCGGGGKIKRGSAVENHLGLEIQMGPLKD